MIEAQIAGSKIIVWVFIHVGYLSKQEFDPTCSILSIKAIKLGIQNILEILLQDIEIPKMESVVQQIILRLFLNLLE